MAAVPEAMALGLGSARMVLPPEMRSSPAVSFSLSRNLRLPEFSGLKIQQNSKCSPSLTMFNSGKSSRVPRRPRGGIVCEAQETAVDAAVPSVTDATWQSLVLKAEGPVLVEFWAPWCGPCRMMHPTISELANEYSGRLKCFKLNTDESPSIATQYGVRSIPTTMIFSNGEKKDTVIGAVPKTSLASNIQKFL